MKQLSEFQKTVCNIVDEVTKNNKIEIDIISYDLTEDIETEETSLKNCLFKIKNFPESKEETTFIFNSEGKGFVDALYNGLIKELNLFSTLDDFTVSNFKILTDSKLSTQGKAVAQLTIKNNTNKEEFIFHSNKVFSINAAAIETIIFALEFFINAEQAVKLIQNALKDSKKRYRHDLTEKYISHMVQLTKVTSYALIVEKEKKKN